MQPLVCPTMPHPLAGLMKRETSDTTDQWETPMVRSNTSGPLRRPCADGTIAGWAPMDPEMWWLAAAVVMRRTLKRNEPTHVWSTWTSALLASAESLAVLIYTKKTIKTPKTKKKKT